MENNLLIMAFLHIENLKIQYRRSFFNWITVLSNVTIELKENRIYGLVGPNGAGKTTLFKTILGLIPHYKGSIQWFGGEQKLKKGEWLKKIGYVPEQAHLPGHLNAFQFLSIYGGMYFPSAYELERSIFDKLEMVELVAHKLDNIKTYSKGMKKRLMIAHAILHDPVFLILDEPFEGLDPMQRVNMKEILTRFREEGKTVFISSHELYELQNLCDSVVLLEKGRVRLFAPMEKADLQGHFSALNN